METMVITIICLLQLFSQMQPATGELRESVGKQATHGNYVEIVCSFEVNVSLSRVDFVNKTGTNIFAIVDCGTSCNVLRSYQDVLRIVSPLKTISGDSFVFNATNSDKTTGTYTCHGIPKPQEVNPSPSGTGDGDGGGDGGGEESHKTSAATPETDEATQNAGGNGLVALVIIPILLVPGVVLFLHWWGVIQLPFLPKTRGSQDEPRDLRRIVRNLLQPFIGCWRRIRHLCHSTCADEEPSKSQGSNHDQDVEAALENEALLYRNEDKPPLHFDATTGKYPTKVSLENERNDERKDDKISVGKEQSSWRDSYNDTELTQDKNARVEERQTLLPSALSPNSTDTKDENSDVEVHQTSPQPADVAGDRSAAPLSGDSIRQKEKSADTNSRPSALPSTGASKPKSSDKPPIAPKPRTTSRDLGQHTLQTSGTGLETELGKNESMKEELKTPRNIEGIEGTEEREGARARVDVKEEESSEAKSETINNGDMNGPLTSGQNKEDVGGKKEVEIEMKEKENMEIKSGTESKEDARQKHERIKETMAETTEREDKEEAKSEVKHAQEPEAEAVREQTADTRAETVQTSDEEKKGSKEDDDYETASDADDADRSRNDEGAVDVDKLDGASSTGQNLVDTDQSNPEHNQECSDDKKRQTIKSRLRVLSDKFNELDDNNV